MRGRARSEGPEVARRAMSADVLALLLITCLSAAPYVTRLGLYSDDWSLLSAFYFDSLAGKFGAEPEMTWDFSARPLQGFYLAGLYKIFGLDPLGYHLVNSAVIAACMPLFYSLLLRLHLDRRTALAAAIIFITLPQLSTIRVWYAAFQIPLSLLLALLSLHAQLSFARTARLELGAGALLSGILSAAAYEIFFPLLLGFAIALVFIHWRNSPPGGWREAGLMGVLLISLGAALVVAKFATSGRAPAQSLERYLNILVQLFRPDYDWRDDYGLNVLAALDVHFISTVAGWAHAAVTICKARVDVLGLGAALCAAGLTFWRLTRGPKAHYASGRALGLGTGAFVLGHAPFLVSFVIFSTTGMANRTFVAGAIGVALILVAALAYAARLAPRRWRDTAFATVTSVIVVLALTRLFEINNYWAEAPRLQQQVLTRAATDLARVPTGSIVILDGVCPYHGPAVVFENSWDFAGALSLTLGRPIKGDAMRQGISVTHEGLATKFYGNPVLYRYGPRLFVYNPGLRLVESLPNIQAVQTYFARKDRWPSRCPPGRMGHGVLI